MFQPEIKGPSNAFVAKFDTTTQSFVYSTYLGGSGYYSLKYLDLRLVEGMERRWTVHPMATLTRNALLRDLGRGQRD